MIHAKHALVLSCSIALCACGHEKEHEPEPALVRTAAAEKTDVTRWLPLDGRVVAEPDRDAVLSPRVAGRLQSVRVREGDLVRSGQVVATVDTGPLDDAVAAAEAVLSRQAADARFKRSVADRSAALLAKGVISREQSDSDDAAAAAADASRAEAAAALATARRQRGWASVTAPFDGVVVRVLRREGEAVDGTPGTPVAEIADPDPWEVAASATAPDLGILHAGQPARIGTEARGRVVSVAGGIDPATGAGEVRLRPDPPAGAVPLGTPLEVRVALETRQGAVVVPASAIRRAEDGTTEVVVVEGGIAHVRKVTTGIAEEDRVEILSGLAAGARVAVEDPLALAEGAAVREGT
jgi:multidrug efflux system membrane fusion protein